MGSFGTMGGGVKREYMRDLIRVCGLFGTGGNLLREYIGFLLGLWGTLRESTWALFGTIIGDLVREYIVGIHSALFPTLNPKP